MGIKARPFKTHIDEIEVEGYFDDDAFVFRFYGLIEFRPPVTSIEKDDRGEFAVLQETEVTHPDGFALSLETQYDSELGSEWGYAVSLKRNEITERDLFENLLRLKGVDPNSVNLIVPPRQSISVFFDPRGMQEGSARLNPVENDAAGGLIKKVRSSATKRILFLLHAVRQMSRPDRMITTPEVRAVVANGVVIEDYPADPRGHSCLLLGWGTGDRPIHVVCSPKPDFLAIITAYLPDPREWSYDFKMRTNR